MMKHFSLRQNTPIVVRLCASLVLGCAMFSPLAFAEEPRRDTKIDVATEGLPKKVTFKAKDLYQHAKFLASDECEGRLPGTPGVEKARKYIEKQLKNAGFDEIKRLPFEFISDVKLGKSNTLAAHYDQSIKTDSAWYRKPNGTTANYKIDDDFRPSRISKVDEIKDAPLVFAGYGISAPDKGYDDYANLDVKDKVVLVIRGEPETADGKRIGKDKPDPHAAPSVYANFSYKAATARDKGAKAVVFVNGKRGISAAERAQLESFERGGGRSDSGIVFLQVFPEIADDWLRSGGKTIETLQKAIDEKLAPQSFSVNGVKVSAKVEIERVNTNDVNLAVVIPGSDPVLKNEIVVIGAHYDHLGRGNEFSLADKGDMGKIHYGADDNASGTASVLEVAEALYKNRAALKRTVWIMFFGAEEMGTIGSNHFVRTPPEGFAIPQVAAMLNLDMVGRCREKKVMVYGVATGTTFEETLKGANESLKLNITTTADGFGGSDQTAFVAAGVPVLFFFTGSHFDYHKPSDTADKLNVDDQAIVTALVYSTAARIINAPARPQFVKVEAPKTTGFGGIVLSVLPDYSFEGKGLRLSGVRDKGPADKAGLKGGDIITKLDGKNIENIQDYMNALRQLVAGVETSVSFTRDGKPMETKITPEKR
ncbi:MAG TPA: M20/M25/M40 family metallo-hydrolase [Planctomycetota bacterium]|nr:M20/M25/M40 family metallo-hydrolase [Planctomycetota bacterium]